MGIRIGMGSRSLTQYPCVLILALAETLMDLPSVFNVTSALQASAMQPVTVGKHAFAFHGISNGLI